MFVRDHDRGQAPAKAQLVLIVGLRIMTQHRLAIIAAIITAEIAPILALIVTIIAVVAILTVIAIVAVLAIAVLAILAATVLAASILAIVVIAIAIIAHVVITACRLVLLALGLFALRLAQHAGVMLGMLQKALLGDAVIRELRVTGECQVFFDNLLGGATHLAFGS